MRELANVVAGAVLTQRGTVLEADQLPEFLTRQPQRPGGAFYGPSLLKLKTGLGGQELDRLASEFPAGQASA